jgi:hypothetical protein
VFQGGNAINVYLKCLTRRVCTQGICRPERLSRDLPWGRNAPSKLRRQRRHWKVALVSESFEMATRRNVLPEHSRSAGPGPTKCRPFSSPILISSLVILILLIFPTRAKGSARPTTRQEKQFCLLP